MQAAIGAHRWISWSFSVRDAERNFGNIKGYFPNIKIFYTSGNNSKLRSCMVQLYLSLKEDAPFTRNDFVKYLNENLIETRNIFAGNIIRQPAFMNRKFRIAEHLDNTDFIMNNTFFLGTYPGLTKDMIEYIAKVVHEFMGNL